MATDTEPDTADRHGLRRWALRLAYATIAWNVIEAVVAITAGRSAGSIGLISFGLDSTIEVASASVVVWQFRGGHDEQREHRALRAIAVSFFALAGYAAVQSVVDLVTRSEPEASTPGIIIAGLSLIVMPALAWAKRRVGHRLGSRTVIADSAQTMLCTYLSAALLAGLLGNAIFGWWWADPLVALVVAALATLEGREAWQGEADDCCNSGLT
jgi:divalent metal cation (Fe/Co/Zn/Cd) transporter